MISEFQGKYCWMSNFAPCKVRHNGIEYQSTENFYQAMKTKDLALRQEINAATPGQAKRFTRHIEIREDWDEELKVKVMTYALLQKFQQEPYRNLLIQTGEQHIQEGNNWNDKFWGVCLKTNEGKNMLGKLLMQIRSNIQLEEALRTVQMNNDAGRYTKLPAILSKRIRKHYEENLKIEKEGDHTRTFYSEDLTPVAIGYNRVVIGDYGPFVEFTKEQLQMAKFKDKWPRNPDKDVYYYWLTGPNNIKCYEQVKTVSYADYLPGMYYISPKELYKLTKERMES